MTTKLNVETIERAAVLHKNGFCSLPPPNRHCHILSEMHAMGFTPKDCTQGFMTSFNSFVTREGAYKIAKNAGQIIKREGAIETPGVLFSEDLW